jgi:hypothetical protein
MSWVPAGVDRGILVVAAEVPSGRTAATTAGTPANPSVCTNALDNNMTPVAQAEPAGAGPTDPDRTAAFDLAPCWRQLDAWQNASR